MSGPSSPTRADWRAALAAWADPDGDNPLHDDGAHLPDELASALESFLAVDDTTEPASELEVASILNRIRAAEAERRRQRTTTGWQWLAAVLAVTCLSLLFWRGVRPGTDSTAHTTAPNAERVGGPDLEMASDDLTVVELSTDIQRGSQSLEYLPNSARVILVLHAPNLDASTSRVEIELTSGSLVQRFDRTVPTSGVFFVSVNREVLPQPNLRIRLLDASQNATWSWVLERPSPAE